MTVVLEHLVTLVPMSCMIFLYFSCYFPLPIELTWRAAAMIPSSVLLSSNFQSSQSAGSEREGSKGKSEWRQAAREKEGRGRVNSGRQPQCNPSSSLFPNFSPFLSFLSNLLSLSLFTHFSLPDSFLLFHSIPLFRLLLLQISFSIVSNQPNIFSSLTTAQHFLVSFRSLLQLMRVNGKRRQLVSCLLLNSRPSH